MTVFLLRMSVKRMLAPPMLHVRDAPHCRRNCAPPSDVSGEAEVKSGD